MTADDRAAIQPDGIAAKAAWRRMQASLDLQEKVRILLQLQKDELPLLQKQRPLRSWEKPWPIKP
jgi:hypothetical protein